LLILWYTVSSEIGNELKKAELFKRFINDIIWVSFGKQQIEGIKCHLQKVFKDLDFRQVNANDIEGKVKFLG